MMNTGPWLQHVAERLSANGYSPLEPSIYQSRGIRYAVRRSGFEVSKFGMVDRFFVFAEAERLDAATLANFSSFAFNFANANKSNPLPNGFFMCTFTFPVVITQGIDPQLAAYIRQTNPPKHWSAFEMPVAFDLASGELVYFQTTPVWGAAYFAGMRNEIENNLR